MDGEGIKLTRKRLQLSQAEMAVRLGVSRQSYIAWEKNTYRMPSDKVEQLLALDASVPAGLAPRETDKQRLAREAAEAKQIKLELACYRATRAYCRNHAEAMGHYRRNRSAPILPIAYAAIVAEFPDILTDPDGDHAMTKEQSQAIILETVKG